MSTIRQMFSEHGTAAWLDFIQRSLLTGGGLARLVADDGVRGVTSNPSIFEKAIGGSADYADAIRELVAGRRGIDTAALYEALVIDDIRLAADILRPVYEESDGTDGFVSLEVSPHLARDGAGTVAEARRLWREVARPNLMIKVPATPEGMPAVETLLAEGVNVNVTLMFSLAHYEAVAAAYLRGLEANPRPARVASVASFFVSRVDTAIDAALERIGTAAALALQGRAAIANAALAYRRFEDIFRGDAFAAARRRGARVQRPLWASTSTKNPAYRDVVYVEELIGADTVNTLPLATLEAVRDHGRLRPSLAEHAPTAAATLAELAAMGIDLAAVTEQLQVDGLAAFSASFDTLMATLERARGGGV